jgi:uncharacterized membrane protein YebE (DUF533 family)
MDPSILVDGVLRSVLGGRRKRSRKALKYVTRGVARSVGGGAGAIGRAAMSNPTALLTAAGVLWGLIETLQGQGGASGGAPASGGAGFGGQSGAAGVTTGAGLSPAQTAGGSLPPLPVMASGAAAPPVDDATRLVQLAVSAARADGALNDEERAAILERATAAGVGAAVAQEFEATRPLADIVAGVSDPGQRATLYGLAFAIARADEGVNGAERIYLARLAQLLGLDAAAVARIEAGVITRIDGEAE